MAARVVSTGLDLRATRLTRDDAAVTRTVTRAVSAGGARKRGHGVLLRGNRGVIRAKINLVRETPHARGFEFVLARSAPGAIRTPMRGVRRLRRRRPMHSFCDERGSSCACVLCSARVMRQTRTADNRSMAVAVEGEVSTWTADSTAPPEKIR